MSGVLKLSGPIKVGNLDSDPANPEDGYVYFNATTGDYRIYENGAFRVISAEELAKLGTLNPSPTNYSPTSATYAGHLEGIDNALGNTASDAADVTYTPAVLTDWNGDADPGNADAALDQLAERVDDNEIAIATKADQSVVAEIDQNVDDLISLTGVPENSTDLGTFSGDVITDSSTIKTALQELETELVETRQNTDDLVTLSGVAENSTDLGAFTGSIITDNSDIKTAFQELETEVETKAADADVVKKDGSVAFEADQSMGGNKLTNLAEPTTGSDAATKSYVDSSLEGLKPKEAVRVATDAAGTLASDFENGDTVDGVTLSTGDRILIKNQVSAEENGIYTVNASGAPTRATDFDSLTPIDEINGAYVSVQEGTSNAGKVYVQTGTVSTIDTDPINFVFFNSSSALVGGDGIAISGSNISVDHSGQGLAFNGSSQLDIELDGATLSKSATGIRVAVQTANRALISDASGNLTSSPVTSTEVGHLSGVTSAIQTQLDAKLENIVEDTTPELGGNLNTAGNAILHDGDGIKRGNAGSPSNLIEEEYIDEISLAGSQTDTVISALTFAHASFEGLEMVYKIKEATSGDVRIGTVRVVTNGTDVVLNDIATETNDTGITFSAVVNGSNINIRYSSGVNGATMRADVKRIRA